LDRYTDLLVKALRATGWCGSVVAERARLFPPIRRATLRLPESAVPNPRPWRRPPSKGRASQSTCHLGPVCLPETETNPMPNFSPWRETPPKLHGRRASGVSRTHSQRVPGSLGPDEEQGTTTCRKEHRRARVENIDPRPPPSCNRRRRSRRRNQGGIVGPGSTRNRAPQ